MMYKAKRSLIFVILLCMLMILIGCSNNYSQESVSSTSPMNVETSSNIAKEESNLDPNEVCVGLADDLDEQLAQLGLQDFSCQLIGASCSCSPKDVEGVEIKTNFNTGSTLAYVKDQEPFLLVKPGSNFRWEYSERDGVQLYYTVEEYLSPFSRTNGDALIVDSGSTRYGSEEDNTARIRACGSTPDEIDYCFSASGLEKRGFSDKMVDIYIPVSAQWDLSLEGSHPISNIKEQTEANKVLKFTEYIPPIDDYGFVDIKYVDRYWCDLQTGEMEYEDQKPKCQKVVDELRVKVKDKVDKERPFWERKACLINCADINNEHCASNCCDRFMEQEGYYEKYLNEVYRIHGQEKTKYLQCSNEIFDEFLASKVET